MSNSLMQKGFSLVEIIVVIAIIAVLSTVSLFLYQNYTQGRILDSEAKKIVDIISLAQTTSQNTSKRTCPNGDAASSKIQFDNNSTSSYSVVECCEGEDAGNCKTETHPLPKNMTMLAPQVQQPPPPEPAPPPYSASYLAFQKNEQFLKAPKEGESKSLDDPLTTETTVIPPGHVALVLKNTSTNKCVAIIINGTGVAEENSNYPCPEQ